MPEIPRLLVSHFCLSHFELDFWICNQKVLTKAVMHPSSDSVHVENTSRCHSEAPLPQCCTPVPWGTEPSFIGTSFSSFLYLRLNKEGLRRKQWRITGEDIYCLFGDLLFALLFIIWKYYFSYYLLYWFVVIFQLLSQVWLFATPWTAACQASLSFTLLINFF